MTYSKCGRTCRAACGLTLGVVLTLATPLFARDAGPGRSCDVRLSKLSYDDPGADDNEWIELRVTCAGALPATLGEAGVSEFALFNGGSSGCPIYRRVALADVRVGPHGFSVICSAGSELDLDLGCEQTAGSSGPLGQSWLQNGPGDGLALIDDAGEVMGAYLYGAPGSGAGSCPDAVLISEDPGPSQGEDSAVVVCPEGDLVVPMSQVPLRSALNCSVSNAEGDSGAQAFAGNTATPGTSAAWPTGTVRHAEPTHVTEPAATPRAVLDAGSPAKSAASAPPDLGCGFTPLARSGVFAGSALVAVLFGALCSFGARRARAPRKTALDAKTP